MNLTVGWRRREVGGGGRWVIFPKELPFSRKLTRGKKG